MSMQIRRIVIFAAKMAEMTAFYREMIGLAQKADEPGWKEFESGAIALHNGTSEVGRRPPKWSSMPRTWQRTVRD